MPIKFTNSAKKDLELLEKAKDLTRKGKSKVSTVAAVLKTKNNKIFNGMNIGIECLDPCSIYAAYVAIGTMVSEVKNRFEK